MTSGLSTADIPESITSKTETREEVREWDYGAYEGITSSDIGAERARAGMEKWDIWRDGCPDGIT